MKITQVRVLKVQGQMAVDGTYEEDRFARPLDIYDAYRNKGGLGWGQQQSGTELGVTQYFLEIETDDGVTGVSGAFREPPAHIIATQLRPILLGQDPLATEYLWDVMFRSLPHGRQGEAMFAVSNVDCALWDLKGKWLNQPVWRVLGGPMRKEIPVYASMLGYSTGDMGKVKARAQEFKEKGFTAQKWFIRHGPMSSHDGLKKNVELVRTVRESVGEDYDIMIDCWQSFDFRYMLDLAKRIEDYRPFWLEEPMLPDRIDSHKRLKDAINIPLAGAEHDYTRWGMLRFLEKQALDIYQPDPFWCGGISETLKITALTTTHDVICIPHGHSTRTNIQITALQPPIHSPYQEYLVKWNDYDQHLLKHQLKPVDGKLTVPEEPGTGIEIDWDKVTSHEEL